MNVSVGNIVLLWSRCTYEYFGGEHRALEFQVFFSIVFIKHAPSPWGDTSYCYITSN